MKDPMDGAEQEEQEQLSLSPCFPVTLSHAAGHGANAWDLGVRESVRYSNIGGCGRERENKRQVTPNNPLFIPFISKQTLGPVFPALKDFFILFLFKPCCSCC